MSILDIQNKFSSAQAIVDYDDTTAGSGDAAGTPSTNLIDQVAAGDAYSHPLWLVVLVDTTFTSGSGSAALQVALQTATDAAFTTPIVVEESPLVPITSLVAKATVWKTRLPRGLKQFIRLAYKGAAADFTAGKVTAFLTPDHEGVGQMLRPSGDPA